MQITDSERRPATARCLPKPRSRPVRPPPEFPVAARYSLKRGDLETYEGRFEYLSKGCLTKAKL